MSTVLGNANASLFISATKIALQLDEIDVLTLNNGSSAIDMGGYVVTNITEGDGASVISKDIADARYYASTVTLNSITAPNGSLSLNSQRIVDLADPVDT